MSSILWAGPDGQGEYAEYITTGDRVTFTTREMDPDNPAEDITVTLAGTVTRGPWGRAQNVTILSDDGRTFARLLPAVALESSSASHYA